MYGTETSKWNEAEQSRVQTIEHNYVRAAAGVTLMARVKNDEICETFGMSERAVGIYVLGSCGTGEEKYADEVQTCEKNARGQISKDSVSK